MKHEPLHSWSKEMRSQEECGLFLRTRCIPHVFYISESNCYSNAEDHEHPVDLWNVNLAMYLFRCVNDLDSWEATE